MSFWEGKGARQLYMGGASVCSLLFRIPLPFNSPDKWHGMAVEEEEGEAEEGP